MFINSLSHSSVISEVLGPSTGGLTGSSLWWVAYSITLTKIGPETFGNGIGFSSESRTSFFFFHIYVCYQKLKIFIYNIYKHKYFIKNIYIIIITNIIFFFFFFFFKKILIKNIEIS